MTVGTADTLLLNRMSYRWISSSISTLFDNDLSQAGKFSALWETSKHKVIKVAASKIKNLAC